MKNNTIRFIFGLFTCISLFGSAAHAHAATLYWYSTDANFSSNNWENIDHWWTDADHLSPARRVPSTDDTAVILGGVINTHSPHADVATWIQPSIIDSSLNDGTQVYLKSENPDVVTATIIGNAVVQGHTVFDGTATSGVIRFEYRTQNTGEIQNAIFSGESINHQEATATGDIIFEETAINYGHALGKTLFTHQSMNSGVVSGTTSFLDESENSSAGTVTGASASFDNSSRNRGTVDVTGDTHFNNTASNSDGTVTGHAIFSGTYSVDTNFGQTGSKTINAIELIANDVWNNPIEGVINSVSLANNSKNIGTIQAQKVVFSGLSTNEGTVKAGQVSFYDGGANNGLITASTTTFYNGLNNGNINGNAVFINELPEYISGTISGKKTRRYTVNTTTTRNFVTGGPWTVVADGAVVNYCGATYDKKTIFSTINKGSFVMCTKNKILEKKMFDFVLKLFDN